MSENFCEPLQIGAEYLHPKTGRLIRIIEGNWEIGGRISNHWRWVYLDNGKHGCGYGWRPSACEPGQPGALVKPMEWDWE